MLHRYVFFLANGHCPKIVDHINRNRYDCRIGNLREADTSINNRNRSYPQGKYPPGVTCLPKCKTRPYQAKLTIRKNTKYLGYFSTPEQASAAVANAKLAVL